MPCFVYVIGSRRGDEWRTYVGWTTDLDQRLARHNSGKGAKSTRGRQWNLLYAERYRTRSAAMSREWHLKRDRAFRKALWANDGVEKRLNLPLAGRSKNHAPSERKRTTAE